MTIRNKDGSIYRIKGPNPLAKSQNIWDDRIVLHNMEWDEKQLPDEMEVKRFNSDFFMDFSSEPVAVVEIEPPPVEEHIIDKPVDVYEPEPNVYEPEPNVYEPEPNVYEPEPDVYEPEPDVYETEPDVDEPDVDVYEPKEEITEEPKPEIVKSTERRTRRKNVVDMWCLPALIRDYEDGQQTIEYFDKVLFESIILQNDGLTMTFWTNVDVSKRGSIVRPFRNEEGRPYDDYGWWKVERIMGEDEEPRLKKSGGWIYECFPSEYTPHFAD